MGINLGSFAVGDYVPLGGGTMTDFLTFATSKGIKAAASDGSTILFQAQNAAGGTQTVAQISSAATVANSTFVISKAGAYTPYNHADIGDATNYVGSVYTGYCFVGTSLSPISGARLYVQATVKLQASSGVVGYSVVNTDWTLGSLGTIIIPQSAANVTDALAGNIAGSIALDLTNAAERLYFRGSAGWFYIAKTGGLSMTKEERIDPSGHEFQPGDEVKLIVDKINPDGSFHALPYLLGNRLFPVNKS